MSEIETLVAEKKWKQAQVLLPRELLTSPTGHWVWFTLSLTVLLDMDVEPVAQGDCGEGREHLRPAAGESLPRQASGCEILRRPVAAIMALEEDKIMAGKIIMNP